MGTDHYSISQLVDDLKQVCEQFKDEREILSRARPLARRAALSKATWLEDRMYHAGAAQGFGVYHLHEQPDHTLAILAVSWLPNRGAPPHDHGTWAVIAGVDGPEKNEFFERADDRSHPGHAELKKVGEKVCGVGDVVAMRSAALLAGLAFFANWATGGDTLEALLARDPVAEAARAFAAGDRKPIVVPVCGREPGEVIPGWPPEDRVGPMRAIGLGQRPISCADLGDDPTNLKLRRALRYAELYNRKLLQLEGRPKR